MAGSKTDPPYDCGGFESLKVRDQSFEAQDRDGPTLQQLRSVGISSHRKQWGTPMLFLGCIKAQNDYFYVSCPADKRPHKKDDNFLTNKE